MKSGLVDIFSLIGTASAAKEVLSAHPNPHRLRVCLGLEAKNPAFILPDATISTAVAEIRAGDQSLHGFTSLRPNVSTRALLTHSTAGSLSFNGQRCTALKIIFVHSSLRAEFLEKFCGAVDSMPLGLPWVAGVGITPLPEEEKPKYLRALVDDAVSKGAKIVNGRGGQSDRTMVAPTVLFPVLPGMRVYSEEQFGPVVPVVEWTNEQELYDYLIQTTFGQQASIFTQNSNSATVGHLIDVLSNQVSRININCQCQRGPDSFPFTGRKDSAYGTLSVFDALRVFSLRSLVAAKDGADAQLIAGKGWAGGQRVLECHYYGLGTSVLYLCRCCRSGHLTCASSRQVVELMVKQCTCSTHACKNTCT